MHLFGLLIAALAPAAVLAQSSSSATTTTRVTTTSTGPTATPSSSGTAGCGKSPGQGLTSGTYSINVNGANRRYNIRLPDGYNNNRQYRVYFVYHPLGGSAATTVSAKYNELLNQGTNAANAIFVAPEGLNNGWANSGGADIALTDAINKLIDNGLCVNPTQRFAIGFSYGAGMSFSVACSRAKVFRAVTVIAGAQLSGCSGGSDPIAYLGIHGVADGTCTIGGGRSLRDKFVKNNGCQSTSAAEPARGANSHIKTNFQGCRAGFPVTWIAHGGGHTDNVVENGSRWVPIEANNFFNQFL